MKRITITAKFLKETAGPNQMKLVKEEINRQKRVCRSDNKAKSSKRA